MEGYSAEHSHAFFLTALGGMILAGLVTSLIGRTTPLPRVTLLLLFGLAIGPHSLDLIPAMFLDQFDLIAQMALLMVGFLLGSKLTRDTLQDAMGHAVWISLVAALVTALLVAAGLVGLGVSTPLAIVLGCIASATAPAAIMDVVMEGGYEGRFKNLLLSIVALDDAWALMLFGLGVAVAMTLNGYGEGHTSALLMATRDIVGALVLGCVLGVPAIFLTGRLKPGQPMFSEALGLVFLCGGLAAWWEVSFLIAAMVCGVLIANFAKHHEYAFNEIEGVEGQFMVIFFVLAGASLEIDTLLQLGTVGLGFIGLRIAGKLIGARLGAQFSGADRVTKRWMGVAMLPQAGVAIGMALVASSYFPDDKQVLLTVVIGATVFFEITGPLAARLALNHAERSGGGNGNGHNGSQSGESGR